MVAQRSLTPQFEFYMRQPVIYPVFMVSLDWTSGPVYLNSSQADVTWNGNTFTGVGGFGNIGGGAGGLTLAEQRVTMSLVFPELQGVTELAAPIRGRDVAIYLGLLLPSDFHRGVLTVVPDPVTVFLGRMDSGRIIKTKGDNGDVTNAFELEAVSGAPARDAANIYHSYEDQLSAYPGDTAGRHLWDVALLSLRWPE